MQNINYPGDICTAIYHLIKPHHQLFFRLWRVALFVFTVLGGFCIYFTGKPVTVSGKGRLTLQHPGNPRVFILILSIGLIFFRIPNLAAPEENPDEGQFIATAASIYSGAVMWKDVGAAHGPLITMPLCCLNLAGDGLNYTTIRIFGLFCVLLSIFFVWKTIASMYNYTLAGIIALPLTLYFAYANHYDKIAYTSEHVPMLLIAICFLLFFTFLCNNFVSLRKLMLLGFFLGLLPWSKLSAVPIGLAIGLLALFELIWAKNKMLINRAKSVAVFILSALIPSSLFFIYILKNNALSGFWLDNYTFPMLYSKVGLLRNHFSGIKKLFVIFKMLNESQDALYYLGSSLIILLLGFTLNYKRLILKNVVFDKKILYLSLILGSSYLAVIFPGNIFPNYLLMLIVPFAIWIGACMGKLMEFNETIFFEKAFFIPYMLILFGCLLPSMRHELRSLYYWESGGTYKLSEISKNICIYAKPNEKMSIWGWEPKYYVETGLIQANYSATVNPVFFAMDSTKRDKVYLKKYVEEMAINNPVIFLDAVAPEAFYYNDTTKFRHEIMPLLNNFVSKNYQLVKTVKGERIYVLKSRLSELGHPRN